MKQINTLQDLRSERGRLRLQQSILEEEIKENIRGIKSDLAPLQLVRKGANKVLMTEHNGVISDSLGMLSNLFAKKVLFRNAGFFTRLLIPFLIRNLTSNIVHDNKDKILGWVSDIILKVGGRNKERHPAYDKGTADINFDHN